MTGFADFAIVVLNRTVEFDEKISAIQLPNENLSCPQGEKMVVSGWGLTWPEKFATETSMLSRYLMEVNQKCLDAENHCAYMRDYKDDIICAGNLKSSNNSACMGDSGGN